MPLVAGVQTKMRSGETFPTEHDAPGDPPVVLPVTLPPSEGITVPAG